MMFWLGFLFGDENRKLKDLEQRKKDRQAERDRETLGFMVDELTPQLDFMKKNNLENLTFTLLDSSKFDYSLLSQALSKIGSKIAYTRLEKFEGKFLLTLYKNRPEAISRLHRAYILRVLLWFVFALVFTVPVYLFSKTYLDLLQLTFFAPTLFEYLLALVGVSVIWSFANISSSLVFCHFKLADEFKNTIIFDKVVEDD
jgi:hypothetical protein